MHRNEVYSGSDLREWVNSRGLTTKEAASLIGIHPSTLRSWFKKPHLYHHRRWIPTLLYGVERRIQSRDQQRRRRARERAKALSLARIERLKAIDRLPDHMQRAFSDERRPHK